MPTRVVVLGGGVAGMSAAHELVERGFEVVVLERRGFAGERPAAFPSPMTARTEADMSSPAAPRAQSSTGCPASMGFASSPASTSTSIDTMRRIPSFDGRKAADHLVPTTRIGFTQYDEADVRRSPSVFPLTPGDAGAVLRDILLMFEPITDLTPDDLAFFGARVWQILTSCTAAKYRRVRADEAGGTSSAPKVAQRPTRSSLPRASRAPSSPPRRARPARARSATYSCSLC